MACSFVPAALFQRIADDASMSQDVRDEAQQIAQQINQIHDSAAAAVNPQSEFRYRYDEVPTGLSGFSAKIYSMAAKSSERNAWQDHKDAGPNVDAGYSPLPGIPLRTSKEPAVQNHEDVNTCLNGLKAWYDFMSTVFGRNSVDGQGLQLEASIHYQVRYDNAGWYPRARQMVFGDGDGNTRFNRRLGYFKHGCFVDSLDVIGHELAHGVTQFTAGLEYERESGALNESLSDVFGSMLLQWKTQQTVDQAHWLMGKDIIYQGSESLTHVNPKATSLRSMKNPSADTNLFPQPDTMKSPLYVHTPADEKPVPANDYGGVHSNSGVPNFAFYKVAMALGGHSWDRAGKIWYASLTDSRLKGTSGFAVFANITIDQAKKLYSTDANVAKTVADTWKAVGVL